MSNVGNGLLVYSDLGEEIMAYQKDGRFEDWSDMEDPEDSWVEWQGGYAKIRVRAEMTFDSLILPEEYLK